MTLVTTARLTAQQNLEAPCERCKMCLCFCYGVMKKNDLGTTIAGGGVSGCRSGEKQWWSSYSGEKAVI